MNIPRQRYSFRCLLQVLLLACVLCVGTGCTAWYEAQTVVQKADSLDTHGIIYKDTMALRQVIRTWEKPLFRTLMHDDLGKAYYYLGRNKEDYYRQYVEAAKCYIRSDQLHMSDPIRRGRVNSCMGYLCNRGREFDLETEFYQRALNSFQTSGNDYYYAHSLLDLSAAKRRVEDYQAADSLWQIAAQHYYNVDATLPPRICLIRGVYFKATNELDSALRYLWKSWTYPNTRAADSCYCALQLMRVYSKLDSLDLAVRYARYILSYAHSSKLTPLDAQSVNEYCTDAYYVVMQQAEQDNATQLLADYSHQRADLFRLKLNQNTALSEAVAILEQYLENSQHKIKTIYIKVVLIACIFICIVGIFVYHKRQRNKLSVIVNENLTLKQEQMETKSKMVQQHQDKKERIEDQIKQYALLFDVSADIWDNYVELHDKANLYLCNVALLLQQVYTLSQQDIKICIMTLLGMSRKDMALKLYRAESSIPKLRSRTAKILGTDSVHLRDFLIEFLSRY